jgi:S-formylglutathione hydrolase
MERLSQAKMFGGFVETYKHRSKATGTDMTLGLYLPPAASTGQRVPILWWLSGLACTEQNFLTKAGAQRFAAERGIALVVPDTSPRGLDLPGEHDSYDFGSGAGFYIDAMKKPWSEHYRMATYVSEELPSLLRSTKLPLDTRRMSLSGHSMGGHGALVLGLRNPTQYRSISAFAPICHPMETPWGQKAFTGYLGEDRECWSQYDACELMRSREVKTPLLVDQGSADEFLPTQLRPEHLEEAAQDSGTPLTLRYQEGYDHSYYFIATFIGDHFAFHSEHLLS